MTASTASSSESFVHLHVHTEYSMLDGAARLTDVFAEATRLGMPAVAITDHGNLHGAYEFFTHAIEAGVKPIIGVEAYVAPETRTHKAPVRWGPPHRSGDDVSGAGAYTHMTLWARNATGLANLFRMQSRASLEGFFRKPRVDRELLAQYADGVLASTGCGGGEVQTRLRLGQPDAALRAAADLRDIFGPENLFVEMMDHGTEFERRTRPALEHIATRLDLPFVVTNDSHYTYEREAGAHAALLCVQTASTLAEPAMRFDGTGYFLKSAEQMRAIDADRAWQAGCRNTLRIAERVDTSRMFAARNLMPAFPIPPGTTEEELFRAEVWRGMDRRFPDGYDHEHADRVEYELGVIIPMGFCSYFLVVADLIMWAKRRGHPVGPGRGSAAASLVSYALGITDLDPIRHGLIFERFLNPERISMPDIDIDFDERGRSDVIGYVTEKYGEDKVASIVTFGTIKAKAAIKDASRVLGFPYAVGDRISKAMPPAVLGRELSLAAVLDPRHPRHGETGRVRELYASDPDVRRVIDTARGLEGLTRQTGVHAAGVVIAAEPLTEAIPVMRRDSDGAVITQFDYPTCEALGLLKMDFLGLRNLSRLTDAVRNIERSRGITLDLLALPLDDRPTYELLSSGDALGLFQVESGGNRALLRLVRPDTFEDICAVGALYRPGPMGSNSHINYALRKHGEQEVTPLHPALRVECDEILGETYGLLIYQEQVQRFAQRVAGYTLGEADLLRSAMGKKKKAILDKEVERFRSGMLERGYPEEAATALWNALVPFSDYAFNKAHAASYGLLIYWTAYLKTHYPTEYMAAVLTSVGDDKDRLAVYLNECRRRGIRVLPPDVDESVADFAGAGDDIRFGLSAVRNLGPGVVEAIVAGRQERGASAGFHDFLAKVPLPACNKRVVESLIKAGAFDSYGHSRRALVAAHAECVDFHVEIKKAVAIGQDSLFDPVGLCDPIGADAGPATDRSGIQMAPSVPDLPEWDRRTRLAHEREMLGLYVSDHPLFGNTETLHLVTDCSIGDLLVDAEREDGATVVVGGLITRLARKLTRKGDAWASLTLEDLEGAIEVLVFPSTYQVHAELLAEDTVVTVRGRLDHRDEGPQLIAVELRPLEDAPTRRPIDDDRVGGPDDGEDTGPVVFELSAAALDTATVQAVKTTLQAHPGDTEVRLHLLHPTKTVVLRLGDQWRVTPSAELRAASGGWSAHPMPA